MKKTLLCFLLLFTAILYSQGSAVACTGQTFNLQALAVATIGNLNPNNTPFSYHFSMNDVINNINPIPDPSNYRASLTNEIIYIRIEGSEISPFLNLTQIPPLSITVISTPIVCSEDTSTLKINVSGGSGSYQYSLNGSPFSSTNEYRYLLAGIYQLKVLDTATGCISNSVHTITSPTPLTATSITENQNTIIIAAGGMEPYQYSLDGVNYQSSNIFSNLPIGPQQIGIRDSQGCSTYIIANVGNSELPLSSGIMTLKLISCWSKGAIRAIGHGGLPPYLYSIDGGLTFSSNDTFDNLDAGTYPVAIKDSRNAIVNNSSIILQPYVPVNATVDVTQEANCMSNGSITITASGGQIPHYYSIDGGVTYSSNASFSNLPPGNYSISVKDSRDCLSNPVPVTIIRSTEVFATASHVPLVCTRGLTSITVNAGGGKAPYKYSINDGAYTSEPTFQNIGYGSYNLKVIDANGCMSTLTHTITQPIPIYADFTIEGNKLTINGQGGVAPYSYSVDFNTFQSGNVFLNLTPGLHHVMIKDTNNCESYNFTVTIAPPLNAAAIVTTEINCVSNSSINVVATGGQSPYSYAINGESYQASNVFNNLKEGSYFITVKDALNSVSITNTITIAAYVPLTATSTQTKIIDCLANANSNVSVKATGGTPPYQYSLNKLPYSNDNSFAVLYPGTYSFDIKDAKGCVYTLPIIIESPSSLVAKATVNKATECGSKDSITITASGGQAPYMYSFDMGVTYSESNTNFATGVQTFFAKDSNGCQASVHIAVEQSILSATITTDIYTKTIKVNAMGGKAPYKYTLKKDAQIIINSQNENVFNNLIFGSYVVEVTDANGCIVFYNTELYSTLNIATVITNVSCFGNNNGKIEVNATGGVMPYSYSLYKNEIPIVLNSNSNSFTNLAEGFYSIRVTDSAGYLSSNDIFILQPTPLVANITIENQTATINTSGGSPELKYAISPNLDRLSSQNVYPNLAPGNYTAIIQDANGCAIMLNFVIEVPAPSANGKTTVNIEFKQGQTLGDLVIEGQNIKWYSTPGSSPTGKTNKVAAEVPLPLSTVLVDGVTYYASQTINGIESKERLAVTAKVNGSLSTPDFELTDFKFYPNPVKHILSIKNQSNIDHIQILSVSGKSVLAKNINGTSAEIDLSGLSTGMYLLNVKSDGKEKAFKFVKE